MNDRFKKVNEKIRILEKKTIRERLLEYFELQYKYTRQRTITLPFNLKETTVYYDPDDPSNNCTRFGKRQDNGMNYIIGVLCVFGFFVLIMLVILLFGILTRR